MRQSLVELYAIARKAHTEIYERLKAIEKEYSVLGDVKEFADAALALDGIEKFLKDSAGDVKQMENRMERVTCSIWAKNGDPSHIETDYAKVIPNIKMMSAIPNRKTNPEGYALLMDHLGVPKDVYDCPEEERPPMILNWPGMVDYLSTLAEQGKPFPPGIDPAKAYPVYSLKFTKRKKEVDSRD